MARPPMTDQDAALAVITFAVGVQGEPKFMIVDEDGAWELTLGHLDELTIRRLLAEQLEEWDRTFEEADIRKEWVCFTLDAEDGPYDYLIDNAPEWRQGRLPVTSVWW